MTNLERKLNEAYEHIAPYISEKNTPLLIKMCKQCECWNGKDHDYAECRQKPCFTLFLGYEYTLWCDGWE